MVNPCFAKLINTDPIELDVIRLSNNGEDVEQYNTLTGYNILSDEEVDRLTKGYIEISEQLYEKLTEDEAWEKLCKGLSKRNQKTLDWLAAKKISFIK